MRFDLHERASGVLLHPTSLPGPHGVGDLGPAARDFAAFLARGGQRWWQVLPVAPTGYGNSPYSALSAFAGHPLLLSLDDLMADGLLRPTELSDLPALPADRVDYPAAWAWKERGLRSAFQRLAGRPDLGKDIALFREAQASWLEDWALYAALKRAHGDRAWAEWPAGLRDRHDLAVARQRLDGEIGFQRFLQWVFARQWAALRRTCRDLDVALMGDVPIFVAHDSADVWARRDAWQLDDAGWPTVVAGVPPDYFSATGQRWGNPLYRWEVHEADGFAWWMDRLRHTLDRFDALRLDHFIGLHRAWAIPAAEPTAVRGAFQPGPGARLLERARQVLGDPLPWVAEDLGLMTPEVHALRDRFELPGLRILQFAFGTDAAAPSFLPYRYPRRCVVYTGTHDNDTTVGWFHGGDAADPRDSLQVRREADAALRYVEGPADEIHWRMMRAAALSVADLCVFPLQDLLGLDSRARMNRPGVAEGNWAWRFHDTALTADVADRLRDLTELAGRQREAR